MRLRSRLSELLLVPAQELQAVSDPEMARELARALLADGGDGRDPPLEGAEREAEVSALVQQLLAGELLVVSLEARARLMDEPRTHALSSLAEPLLEDRVPEPTPTTSWIGVEVVDQRGRPLPMFAMRVDDPAGRRHEARLDARGRARVDELGDDGPCTVTLRVEGEP